MKFVMLSDLHLLWDNPVCRKDMLVKAQWDKLAFIYELAHEEAADVLMAGDITDGPRSWQVLPLLANHLQAVSEWEGYNPSTFVVRGQHDLYMRNTAQTDRTILGVLEKANLIKVLGDAGAGFGSIVGQSIFVYGCSYGDKVPEPKSDEDFNILVIHADITDQSLWQGQSFTDATKFLKQHKDYDFVLTGDIHRAFAIMEGQLRNARWIVNTGPVLRKDADVYNFEHQPHVYLFDTDKVKLQKVIVPHEPAAKVLSRKHIDKAEKVKHRIAHIDDFIAGIQSAKARGRKASMLRSNLASVIDKAAAKEPAIDLLRKVTGWQLNKSKKQRRLKAD